MKKQYLKYILFIFISTLLIIIDQITKFLTLKNLYNKPSVVLIDNILELVYVENRGAAFGILQNKQTIFFVLTILVLIYLIYLLIKLSLNKNNLFYFISLIFIFSGALGNFIDRIRNKYVIDMIYFKPIDFPVFNFADICITVGCAFLIVTLVFVNKGTTKDIL